jgi:hypothetical protein
MIMVNMGLNVASALKKMMHPVGLRKGEEKQEQRREQDRGVPRSHRTSSRQHFHGSISEAIGNWSLDQW